MDRTAKWWGLVLLHNAIVHPLLVLAEILDAPFPANRITVALNWLHDKTVPEGAG